MPPLPSGPGSGWRPSVKGWPFAVDGKALRGIHGEELPGVRLVAGFRRWMRPGAGERAPRPRALNPGVNAGGGQHGNRTYALYGVVGDYCQQIRDAGGDYLVIVKKNQ